MPKCEKTEALCAEMKAPKHCRKADGAAARGPLVEHLNARIGQATEFLRLHAGMVNVQSDPELLAMQEELRQTHVAYREHAVDLDARLHRLWELDQQVEGIHARFLAKAREKGFTV